MQQVFHGQDVFSCAPDSLKKLIDAPPGLRNGFFALGEPDRHETPGVVVLQLDAGRILERHAHDCFRFEIVAEGELYVGDDVLRPGDSMVALPRQFYGPHTAGPEGVTTCEVFSTLDSAYRPIFERPDGTTHQYDYVAGDIPTEEVREYNRRNAPRGAG